MDDDVTDREAQVLNALYDFAGSPWVADDLECADAGHVAMLAGVDKLTAIEVLGKLKRRALVCRMNKGWRLSRSGREWVQEVRRG